jgi:hypothetical protein
VNKYLEKIAETVDERVHRHRRNMGIAMAGQGLTGAYLGSGPILRDLEVPRTIKNRLIGGTLGTAAGVVTGAIVGNMINKTDRKR